MPINALSKTLLLGLISFAVLGEVSAAQYNAVVSAMAQGDEFSSINAALQSAPPDNSPFVIFLKKGVYTERLEVNRDNVTLKGEERDTTVIGANTAAGMLNPQGMTTTAFYDGRYADPAAIGQAVFINTVMDDHIYGWDKMSGKDKQGEKIWFYPQDSRFFEENSHGPGAEINEGRRQLSAAQLQAFTLPMIFPDWTVQ